ncbi:nucleolar protein gar2 [Forsythia ovata]|uniref:Nucleolar protein gar2 n=1 Tax=Forsythia ovata TaxID=205694 RepID=A0ABD1WS52_9LAMI
MYRKANTHSSGTMVLGLRTKTRKSPSVQLDYIIHIQEIKPWPPSQSLRTLRAVLIQWEHGDRNSGCTNQVAPSLGTGSGVGDGRIEFNESFRLPVTLLREMSIKGAEGNTFQKNCVEFNLYEPRRDKTVKGQLLGTAILDLADYGVVKESLSVNAPINCKRTYRNTAQPLLFLKIQPFEKSRTSSSSRDSLTGEASMDRNHGESVSALMSEEYAEEAEVSTFTDDDISSHSSLAASSIVESIGYSSPQDKENGMVAVNGSAGEIPLDPVPDSKQYIAKSDEQGTECHVNSKGSSSHSSSIDLPSDLSWISKKISAQGLQSSASKGPEKERTSNNGHEIEAAEGTEKEWNSNMESNNHEKQAENIEEDVFNSGSDIKVPQSDRESIFSRPSAEKTCADLDCRAGENLDLVEHCESQGDDNSSSPSIEDHTSSASIEGPDEAGRANVTQNGFAEGKNREKHQEYTQERGIMELQGQYIEDKPLNGFSLDTFKTQVILDNDVLSSSKENIAVKSNFSNTDRSKHGKSVRSPIDFNRSNVLARSNHLGDTHNSARGSMHSERRDTGVFPKETRSPFSDSRIQQLEHRIKMLEGELREAAAIEVSLYSVVAEHGSSTTKVHAPARRLSRFYLHAGKQKSKSRRGSAAKSAISGLILAAKACGNDVPRLTFWLSNSIVLRAIISKSFGESQFPISVGPAIGMKDDRNGNKKSSSLQWGSASSRGITSTIEENFSDWENPLTFSAALEKVEAWIFSRIIESIWWQTFIPHMQSGVANTISRSMSSDSVKFCRRTSSSGDQQQEKFSSELWKKAFRDAYERICPVQAGGHECGCLPILSRVIMEQCIARLDVAMFNAILRKSADEIPTDPVADPISDAEVLPIPAGKASFGAGAQLKNAIGNWSRWLTDLFGIDDDDLLPIQDENSSNAADDDERKCHDASIKSFHLLNALSDLMMLPKDMLLSHTVRKEVCPMFGPPLIRRVLNSFTPDEFCPDPIPGVVLEALNSEDPFEAEEDSIVNFPCAAAPAMYQPPSAASVTGILGESGSHSHLTRSGSSLLRKSYTSDDELDELDSPMTSIIIDSSSSPRPSWISRENGSRNAVRYQLLREVWMSSE